MGYTETTCDGDPQPVAGGRAAVPTVIPTVTPGFIGAGRAVFTVENPGGDRYTFRVAGKTFGGGRRLLFGSLLAGPDNTRDYVYLGVVEGANLRLTGASRLPQGSTPVRVLNWALGVVHGRNALPGGYAIHHEGRCGRCGRVLTVPESIRRGLGPRCAGKVGL